MSATELEQLRLRLQEVEAENERLRQGRHPAGVDAALAAIRSAEAEDRLQVILNSATDFAIFTTDQRGFTTSWNEGAWRLLGWHENEIVGQDARVIFTPEDQAAGAPEQEMRTASNEGRAEGKRWHVRKDGSRFWGSGIVMPLRNGSLGFLKILRDNTEKRKNANAVRDTAALKASVLDAALDSIVTITADSIVLEWNPAAEKTFGYSAAEAIGQDIARLIIPPEYRERHYRGMAYYLATGQGPVLGHRIELEAMRAGGSRFPVELAITPITLQGQPHFTAYLRDISDRKHAEAALRLSEARLRVERDLLDTLIHQAPVGISIVEAPSGRSLVLNEKAIELTGHRELGKDISRYTLHGARHPDGTPYDIKDYPSVRALRRAETVVGEEIIYCQGGRDGAGPSRHLEFTSAPVRNKDGQVVAAVTIIVDVEERRQSGRALEQARLDAERQATRTATILAQLAEGVIVTDTSGAITFVNEAASRIHGVEALGVTPEAYADNYHLFTEDGRPYPLDELPLARAVKGETVEDARWRIRRPDGREVIAVGGARPIRTPDEEQVGAVLSLRDDTARATAEAALRESEDRLKVLVDNLPVGVCFADPDGKALLSNPAFRRFVPDASMPSRVSDGEEQWVAWDENGERLPRHRYPGARALRGEAVLSIEFLYRPKEGPEIWTRVSGVPLLSPDGSVAAALIVIADIDAQKQAQEALQRLNQGLAGEVAARTAERDRTWLLSQDLLAVAGFDGYLKAINPAWSRMLGFDEATLLSMPFTDFVHPDDLPAAGEIVGAMMQGQTTERFEDRLRTRDGSYRTVSWTAVPEADVFYAVGRDVTAERRAAETLRQTEEQLRQAQKMEAVGQLTGGVAHDFNNLLTIIRSSVEFLQRPDLPEPRRRRYINAISETVGRAAKLTSQLLAFARRQTLRPEVFDVAARVRSVTDMLQTITGPRIQISTMIDCEPCHVEADVGQFETALVNMAVNARDAMGGEGRLTIKITQAFEIPARRAHPPEQGQFAALSLTDTGSGIAPDKISQIFEPFFTTKEVGKGTGLGLSQVYGFAKQSGGDVSVESEVGRGTTFTLYLPKTDKEAAAEDTLELGQTTAEQGRGRRVLVVEDNTEVGCFSTQLLQDLGYETIWAANADEALKLLDMAEAQFDVVFTDVVMPGMSGVDLAHEIERRRQGLPVVLTSGYSHVLAEEGPRGFELLHKPYSIATLSSMLAKVIKPR